MKRTICFILIIASLAALSAKPEIWTGIGLTSGRNYLSDGAVSAIAAAPDYRNAKYLNTLGPSFEIGIYPFSEVRLGLIGSVSSSFIIMMHRADGTTFGRRTNGDLVWNLNGGLSFVQLFGDTWGFFADGLFTWKGYLAAKTNEKNSRDKAEFASFDEMGFIADLGIAVKNNHSYFKFGFSYSMPVFSESRNGWSLDVFAGGGFVI